MSKVITFSRNFQSTHPRKGEPTYFIEKILLSFGEADKVKLSEEFGEVPKPKLHTIRNGKRFKNGEKFSPRYWSEKPYGSPQVQFSDEKELRVFDIKICIPDRFLEIDGVNYFHTFDSTLAKIAENDGLSVEDFKNWFGNKFLDGQILCWDRNLIY